MIARFIWALLRTLAGIWSRMRRANPSIAPRRPMTRLEREQQSRADLDCAHAGASTEPPPGLKFFDTLRLPAIGRRWLRSNWAQLSLLVLCQETFALLQLVQTLAGRL
jgi:hypothetical protein